MSQPTTSSELLIRERDILTRIAAGGPLAEVLRDLVLMVEQPSGGDMLASILFLSADGKHLLEGAAPSLPKDYNAAIHGLTIGPGVGSCGTAAFSREPVIVADIAVDPLWKDFRELALAHGLQACWSIPIKAADGSILGTFANYYREPKQPTERDMEVISMVARTTGIAIERHRNDLRRERGEEQRMLLLHELNHRVKNVFALTGALIALGARSIGDAKELAASMQVRLGALGRAHELVQSRLSDADADNAHVATFRNILDDILAPYALDGAANRIAVTGTDFALLPTAVTGIALVLHELATNAVKYGCLQRPEGALSVTWTVNSGTLRVIWAESGFTPIAPAQSGFGTTLITNTIEREFRGAIRRDWRTDGLTVTIELPIENVAGNPA